MHPLDEKYWVRPENWRWWGYFCKDDPRLVVCKRPRWAGYTMNFAHRRAYYVLGGFVLLALAPMLTAIAVAPDNVWLVLGACAASIVILTGLSHRMANPKSRGRMR